MSRRGGGGYVPPSIGDGTAGHADDGVGTGEQWSRRGQAEEESKWGMSRGAGGSYTELSDTVARLAQRNAHARTWNASLALARPG